MKQLVLASTSPRRAQILSMLGVPFRIVEPHFKEELPQGMDAARAAEFFASQKALCAARELQNSGQSAPVLAADTAIVLDGTLYGKPADAREAAFFLRCFSAKTHAVYSGIAFCAENSTEPIVRASKTLVTFKPLSDAEIAWYTATDEWRGAAGGYRVQEKGACFITRVDGLPSGVVGLPVFDVYELLQSQGYFADANFSAAQNVHKK
jgi:septum formation protein